MRESRRAWLVVSFLVSWAASAPAQEERPRERQILDPDQNQWVDRPAEPETIGGELEQARRWLATGEAKKARKLLKRWTKDNPDDERYYEAMFLLGEAYFETRDFYKAYESYVVVVQNTGGDMFYKTLRREMDVARAFLSGQKRIVFGFLRLPAYDDGIKILDGIWELVPGTRLGEQALKLKADYYFANGDLDLAQDTYALLSREFPSGRWARLAMFRAAAAAFAAFPGIKFDDRALLDADERYRQLKATYPEVAARENVDSQLEAIRQQRADKDLYIARWYEKTDAVNAAEYYYRRILKDWPDTLAAGQAAARLRGMGIEIGEEGAGP
ncbi:MAG: outer membrane protein assembly factor BamD [Phycisphaerales bacterium]|nr:outer membrane protein assembly factor BamD [Phycisphaerales bacterium]